MSPIIDPALDFEYCARRVLGDTASHIAGHACDRSSRRKWLRRVVARWIRAVDNLDTTEDHRFFLIYFLAKLGTALKQRDLPEYAELTAAMNVISALLGFTAMDGSRLHDLVFTQTWGQYYASRIKSGADPIEHWHDTQNAVVERAKLATHLKAEGKAVHEIALLLNTTEYKVKQLLRMPIAKADHASD